MNNLNSGTTVNSAALADVNRAKSASRIAGRTRRYAGSRCLKWEAKACRRSKATTRFRRNGLAAEDSPDNVHSWISTRFAQKTETIKAILSTTNVLLDSIMLRI